MGHRAATSYDRLLKGSTYTTPTLQGRRVNGGGVLTPSGGLVVHQYNKAYIWGAGAFKPLAAAAPGADSATINVVTAGWADGSQFTSVPERSLEGSRAHVDVDGRLFYDVYQPDSPEVSISVSQVKVLMGGEVRTLASLLTSSWGSKTSLRAM